MKKYASPSEPAAQAKKINEAHPSEQESIRKLPNKLPEQPALSKQDSREKHHLTSEVSSSPRIYKKIKMTKILRPKSTKHPRHYLKSAKSKKKMNFYSEIGPELKKL